jgi:gluconolactonase
MDGEDAVGRIERIDLSTGKVERLYDGCDGLSLRAPNDLVFDRHGGLWFTDMGKRLSRTIDVSAVHYCRVDRAAITAPFRTGLAYNGIGLSPDERSLYVADTHAARLWRFPISEPGVLAAGPGGKIQPEWVGTAPGDARLDSLAVTASGAVCVGTIRTGGITTFAADRGASLTPLPDGIVTNIAFGGTDMATAYITLAETGRLLSMPWPERGLPLNFGYRPG